MPEYIPGNNNTSDDSADDQKPSRKRGRGKNYNLERECENMVQAFELTESFL